jgi:pilus assembly protein CpaF
VEIWICNQYNDERITQKVPDERVLIGRDESCDVTLRSGFVSRQHAKIVFEHGSFFIEPLAVSGLTVANTMLSMHERHKLEYGDEIRIGEFSLYMMQPSQKRIEAVEQATSPRKRVVALEEKMHAELLDNLNLRVTGQESVSDSKLVSMIKSSLDAIIEAHLGEVDREMREYLMAEYLWRTIITELNRRATGKLMYSYAFEDTGHLDQKKEETLSRMVSDVLGAYPLRMRLHTLKEDVSMIEDDWDNQLRIMKTRITPELHGYIVRRMISKEIEDVVLGYGPLQDLLEMPNVNEIMVVSRDRIYIEKDGVLQNTGRSFFSDKIVESIIERIITPVGRRIDRSTPLVDARLPDGSRVNAIIHPLAVSGPTLTIRKFARIPFTIDDLVERGTLTRQSANFLRACSLGRKNLLISGGTGSGKTTTLNVLSNFIPEEERIVTIEDSAELQLHQEHQVRLETRPANIEGKGAYTIRDLVKNALRMRPDRVIVGECRGPEALDMLQAMNTGHDGSLSTIHANNPDDTMLRLETMVLMAVDMPVKAIREQISAAIDVVVQIARLSTGRRCITHISEVIGIDPDTGKVLTEDIYRLKKVRGEFDAEGDLIHTGYIPEFSEELIHKKFMGVEVFT